MNFQQGINITNFEYNEPRQRSLNSFYPQISIFKKNSWSYNLSLRPHDGFSWDKVQFVPNLCSYGLKSCNFKVFMYKYLFHGKTDLFAIIF